VERVSTYTDHKGRVHKAHRLPLWVHQELAHLGARAEAAEEERDRHAQAIEAAAVNLTRAIRPDLFDDEPDTALSL